MSQIIIDDTQALSPEQALKIKTMLEASGLRFTESLPEREDYSLGVARPEQLARFLFVDTETTGANPLVDKIIELGAVLVEVDPKTGIAYRVLATFNELEDPEMPISPEAIEVHGITDEMVKGKKIDDALVIELVSKAGLVVCHNSGFDRKFLENRFPIFAEKAFACSLHQIEWTKNGVSSGKLEFILYKLGFHYTGHRAVNDCYALIEATQMRFEKTAEVAMLSMLTKARLKEIDVAALGAPFDAKDKLKERGYKWHDDGKSKYWHLGLEESKLEDEVSWLRTFIYNNRPFTLRQEILTAKTKFSTRSGEVESVNY